MTPAAARELTVAAARYDAERPGLGAEFLQAVRRTIAQIEAFPESGPPYTAGGGRRVLVGGFPYGVVYDVGEDRVTVVAIAHLRRGPRYWTTRRARD
jgi:plasmid stabilization system protein ParE